MWFNLQRDGTGNGLFNIKDIFAESLQLQMLVLYLQCWSLKSGSYDGWAKCKKKYLMSQIPVKMLKQHEIPNSSLHNLKIYSSEGHRKTSQDELMYLAHMHSNSKHSNFQEKISFQIMGFCFDL